MWKIMLWFKEAGKGILRNLTLNTLASAMTIICLSILAAGIVLGLNAKHLATITEQNMEVTVHIKNDLTNYSEIENRIKELGGVTEIGFVSKEEAYEKMKVRLGKNADMLTDLGYNPLTASFSIGLEDPKQIPKVARTIETWGISTKVNYGEDFLQDLFMITDKAKQWAFWTIIVSGTVAAGMIFIAIKINIFNRNKEIEIKDLIGAGMFNIRIPFILEAVILSMASALIVVGLVKLFYERAMVYVTGGVFTNFLPVQEVLSKMTPLLLLVAFTIALIGSFISTQRYLKRH
jgi:cell division transport system permease protein